MEFVLQLFEDSAKCFRLHYDWFFVWVDFAETQKGKSWQEEEKDYHWKLLLVLGWIPFTALYDIIIQQRNKPNKPTQAPTSFPGPSLFIRRGIRVPSDANIGWQLITLTSNSFFISPRETWYSGGSWHPVNVYFVWCFDYLDTLLKSCLNFISQVSTYLRVIFM